ncbi:hypothetical protein HBI70_033370 [Parastagonospora nodorum]|nr:hypothetical protein HBH51_232540 [Parastagonospora nodorum]KAH4007727.1 hypothetical protein HBI10_000580 [Parastagonospora nodorum]KAH4016460.1 hypothetical protein HBI13_148600 [Parastagonospora nodorum]KAH4069407.1 hypothetical protein HBH50_112740 [Parastagonospora nodorum]KAH4088477.1 hypothetical protein HBH48_129710 [Parastagonospora nodorum]
MSSQPYLEPAPKPNPDNRAVCFSWVLARANSDGWTFPGCAARGFEFASQLLELGVKWDPKTVQYASKTLRGAKWLIDEHFDVNTGFAGGSTILCLAVSYNKEDVIRFLLSIGANPNLGPPVYTGNNDMKARSLKDSPHILNTAAASSTPEIFALLLFHGASIKSSIPLHCAAGYERTLYNPPMISGIPMMKYLVDILGVDVNASDDVRVTAPDHLGQVGTPLDYAVRSVEMRKRGGYGREARKSTREDHFLPFPSYRVVTQV